MKIDTQGADVEILATLLPGLARETVVSFELSPHHLRMAGASWSSTLECLEKMNRIERLDCQGGRGKRTTTDVGLVGNFLRSYPDRDIGYWDLILTV